MNKNIFRPYVMGALPQQTDPALKNALERELRLISTAFMNLPGATPAVDLSHYFNKDNGTKQIVNNDVLFAQGFVITDDVSVEIPSNGHEPVLDLEDAGNVFVPKLLPATTFEDVNAATKGYVDVHDTNTLTAAKAYVDGLIAPLKERMATAWVTFTPSTGAILSAYNVSGVTRVGAGVYTITFTTPMADANYAWSGSCEQDIGVPTMMTQAGKKLTTSLTIVTERFPNDTWDAHAAAPHDFPSVSVTIHGGV